MYGRETTVPLLDFDIAFAVHSGRLCRAGGLVADESGNSSRLW